jgi:hypothetical protein
VGLSSQVLLRALRSDLDLAAPRSPRELDLAASEEAAFLDDDETFSRTVRPPVLTAATAWDARSYSLDA